MLMQIGPVTASSVVASVGDFDPFKNGRAVWRLDPADTRTALERGEGKARTTWAASPSEATPKYARW
jgi:hypothetical protein